MFYELVTPLTKTETFSQYDLRGDKMNAKNLIPFTRQSAKENGAKGGKASGEAKRERKRIKEIIAELTEQEASNTDTMFANYKLDFYTNAAVVAMKLIDKAKGGDIKAIRLLLELSGELERNKVTVNNTTNVENLEENELYLKGFHASQEVICKYMTDRELCSIIDRIKTGQEVPENERAHVLPDGRFICGESMLED